MVARRGPGRAGGAGGDHFRGVEMFWNLTEMMGVQHAESTEYQ